MSEVPVKLVSAATVPGARLIALLNDAYADYFVPIHLGLVQFRKMCRQEDIDLKKSVVAMADGALAGLALLSVREAEGWISGVGVRRAWRRQGIAAKILAYIQEVAKASGLQKLWLEVLTQNEAGLALYKRMGFRWQRDLLVLSLEAGQIALAERPCNVSAVTARTALGFYAAFHEVRAPWQRTLRSLQHHARDLRGLGYWAGQDLAGYLLYEPNDSNYAIYDLAVHPDAARRVEIAESLLVALHAHRTDLGSHIINVPVEDPLAPAFLNLDYRTWQRQRELVWGDG